MVGGWRIAVVRACVLLRWVSNCVPSVGRSVPRGSTQHGGDQLKSLYSGSGVWRGFDDDEAGGWLLAGCFLTLVFCSFRPCRLALLARGVTGLLAAFESPSAKGCCMLDSFR